MGEKKRRANAKRKIESNKYGQKNKKASAGRLRWKLFVVFERKNMKQNEAK